MSVPGTKKGSVSLDSSNSSRCVPVPRFSYRQKCQYSKNTIHIVIVIMKTLICATQKEVSASHTSRPKLWQVAFISAKD